MTVNCNAGTGVGNNGCVMSAARRRRGARTIRRGGRASHVAESKLASQQGRGGAHTGGVIYWEGKAGRRRHTACVLHCEGKNGEFTRTASRGKEGRVYTGEIMHCVHIRRGWDGVHTGGVVYCVPWQHC